MKHVILSCILLLATGMALANNQAYNLSQEAEAKVKAELEENESWESQIRYAVHRAALMTDVKINCSSSGRVKIQKLLSEFNGELREEYESIFSCEEAIENALDGGISEAEIREELGL